LKEKDKMRIREAVLIDLNRLHPNDFNPNEMTMATFSKLTDEIKEDGFKDPLTVIPAPPEAVELAWPDGDNFLIMAGEHRYRAATVLELEAIPCYIEEEWDELTQKTKTVRNNLIRGDLNTGKFTQLVRDLEEKYEIDNEAMAELMGFDETSEMVKNLIVEKERREKTFLDGLLEESKKEKHAVESITSIVSTIFEDAGATVDQGYLMFTFKGELHMVLLMDVASKKAIQDMVEYIRLTGETATDFIREAIDQKLED